MIRNKGLQEDDIQKIHTSAPEQLTDQELLLSSISESDLVRKHSSGWDKEYPKCTFCSKALRFRTLDRFLVVWKEIYNPYTEKK